MVLAAPAAFVSAAPVSIAELCSLRPPLRFITPRS
jgi:hypothetical protein